MCIADSAQLLSRRGFFGSALAAGVALGAVDLGKCSSFPVSARAPSSPAGVGGPERAAYRSGGRHRRLGDHLRQQSDSPGSLAQSNRCRALLRKVQPEDTGQSYRLREKLKAGLLRPARGADHAPAPEATTAMAWGTQHPDGGRLRR